jgi:glucokinase
LEFPYLAKSVLLGDIGATNARFALASKDELGQVRSFEVAKFPQFMDALAAFREEFSSPITEAVIAVAGPVVEQHAKLTNQAWTVDADELKNSLGLQARIINDFQAVALSCSSPRIRTSLSPRLDQCRHVRTTAFRHLSQRIWSQLGVARSWRKRPRPF